MKTEFKNKLLENKKMEMEACKLVRELRHTNLGIGLNVNCYMACKVVQNYTTEKQMKEKLQAYCDNILTKLESDELEKSEERTFMISNLKEVLQLDSFVFDRMTIMNEMWRATLFRVFLLMRDIMYCNDTSYAYGAAFRNQNVEEQLTQAIMNIEDYLESKS